MRRQDPEEDVMSSHLEEQIETNPHCIISLQLHVDGKLHTSQHFTGGQLHGHPRKAGPGGAGRRGCLVSEPIFTDLGSEIEEY